MNAFSVDDKVTVQQVEAYIAFLWKARNQGAANVPRTRGIGKAEYRVAKTKCEYWRFVQAGDHHYFVARVLFLQGLGEYSRFSGHQCIENYLKALISIDGASPPDAHRLRSLRGLCLSSWNQRFPFVVSDECTVILEMYEPFYEIPRYPLAKTAGPDGGYSTVFPCDIWPLDYFVFRMREVLAIPGNTWDIMKNGHYSLVTAYKQSPYLVDLFKAGNINFAD